MGDLIDLGGVRSRRSWDSAISDLGEKYATAGTLTAEFAALAAEDPRGAIDRLSGFIERARDINSNPAFTEAIAGGPNQDWIAPLLNVIGDLYPAFDRATRERALRTCLSYLDGLNYFYSQNHLELMDGPWLVGDILINRGLYWCGYARQCELLTAHTTWDACAPLVEAARSKFWFAMAVINREYASPGVRHGFYGAYPRLVDHTLDAIAGLTQTHAEHRAARGDVLIEESVSHSLNRYDPNVHDEIRQKIIAHEWIELPQ